MNKNKYTLIFFLSLAMVLTGCTRTDVVDNNVQSVEDIIVAKQIEVSENEKQVEVLSADTLSEELISYEMDEPKNEEQKNEEPKRSEPSDEMSKYIPVVQEDLLSSYWIIPITLNINTTYIVAKDGEFICWVDGSTTPIEASAFLMDTEGNLYLDGERGIVQNLIISGESEFMEYTTSGKFEENQD